MVSLKPFKVQLKYPVTGKTDMCAVGTDPGRENIGHALIGEHGTPIALVNLESHNKSVKTAKTTGMDARRDARAGGRQHVRQKKQRKALRESRTLVCDKTARFGKKNVPVISTSYPKMEDGIEQKGIHGKEAQFANRSRPAGWQTPSGRQLVQVHLHSLEELAKLAPLGFAAMEANSFDFQAMDDPSIKGRQYQQGVIFGFDNKREYIGQRHEAKCLLCDESIEHIHHVVPRSQGESDS